MKKKPQLAPNIIKDMKRQKFLIFRNHYRLDHAFFNIIYNTFPWQGGVAVGFVSGFFWTPIFQMGPIVLVNSILTGCVFSFFASLSHKEFDKEKKIMGFEDQYNGKDPLFDDGLLERDFSEYED